MRSTYRAVLLCMVLSGVAATLRAQTVVVRDAGPGTVGRRIVAALAAPHHLVRPASTRALLTRDSAYDATVIVFGRDAVIEGRVHGDVIVVGGNAFVHPGANVDGSVVAIGGGAYGSMLAIVRGGLESHPDFTFDIVPLGTGYALDYRPLRGPPSPALTLPGLYGLRIPMYDRSDGLSLPFAPLLSIDTGRFEVEPGITYRSQIGAIDPSVVARVRFSRVAELALTAERTTLTNERWIWSDLVNSFAVLGLGNDTRNYYRADRGEGVLSRLIQTTSTGFEPRIGVRFERDRAVRPDSFASSGPYSLFGRTSREHMRRPNPPATRGTLQAVLIGGRVDWAGGRVRANVDLENEVARFDVGSRSFVQSTLDGDIRFPTFGAQSFALNAHVIHTFGDSAPPQRWGYLGGSGTLSTFEMLEFGGDRLLYVESNYFIPIQGVDWPILGSPSLTLRHAFGAAGVHRLPSLEQNIAVRLALSFLRVELVVDPEHRETSLGAGLSFTR